MIVRNCSDGRTDTFLSVDNTDCLFIFWDLKNKMKLNQLKLSLELKVFEGFVFQAKSRINSKVYKPSGRLRFCCWYRIWKWRPVVQKRAIYPDNYLLFPEIIFTKWYDFQKIVDRIYSFQYLKREKHIYFNKKRIKTILLTFLCPFHEMQCKFYKILRPDSLHYQYSFCIL